MNPDVFAGWLRLQGHTIIRTADSYWCDQGPRVYQAFPYHWLIDPPLAETAELFARHGVVGLRYSTPVHTPEGVTSYHVVYDEKAYSLDQLPKKARYDVRKALKSARVEPISFARLADEGWRLRYDTLMRQGREKAETAAWWRKLCLSAESLPGFEAWGVTVGTELAASLLAFTCDDCCSILYQQSSTAHLSLGVNNALAAVFTQEALQRDGVTRMFYGLHSLDAPTSVDEFKFRMGYTAKPVRQRVVFHPRLAPFFNPATHAVVKRLKGWWPDNATVAKTEGMLRFYLEGKRPLAEQTWPDVLRPLHIEPTDG